MLRRVSNTVLALGILVMMGAAVQAQTMTSRLKADIPFAFQVGERMMPAGEYLVIRDTPQNMLRIQHRDTGRAAMFIVYRDKGYQNAEVDPRLVFRVYGNKYFLGEVWENDFIASQVLPKSEFELEYAGEARVARRVMKPEIVIVHAFE